MFSVCFSPSPLGQERSLCWTHMLSGVWCLPICLSQGLAGFSLLWPHSLRLGLSFLFLYNTLRAKPQWQNSTHRVSNYPAFPIRAVTSLCRNSIIAHSASAYLLSYTLLLPNNFVKHTHELQAPCFILSVYFEVLCFAAATSACLNLYSASALRGLSFSELQTSALLGQLESPLCFESLW